MDAAGAVDKQTASLSCSTLRVTVRVTYLVDLRETVTTASILNTHILHTFITSFKTPKVQSFSSLNQSGIRRVSTLSVTHTDRVALRR